MKPPGGGSVEIDPRKLVDYALSPDPSGGQAPRPGYSPPDGA